MPKGIYKHAKCSLEKKEKLRKAMKKRIATLGYMNSKETREKISKTLKGKKPANWEKIKHLFGNSYWTGKKRSKETNKKISDTLKRKGIKPTIHFVARGKDSHLWRGGITDENKKIRNSIEIRLWREAVFSRDGWACQVCNEVGGKLEAHHIKNFSKYKKLRVDISNGITLCKKCHIGFHKVYGIKNNNMKQLEGYKRALTK